MTHAPARAKSPQQSPRFVQRRPVNGTDGIAIAPPNYGIDLVDRQQSTPGGTAVPRRADETGHLSERQRHNQTGLPDQVKAGIEALSGLSLDDVRVHYDSARPAAIEALAYTQGTEIHVAPGQERHLPHEAWHVVQQAQGRVQPTMQARGIGGINRDAALEREADVMGAKAAHTIVDRNPRSDPAAVQLRVDETHGNRALTPRPTSGPARQQDVIQANGNKKIVAGTEVTFTPGYASWEQDDDSWHINWALGEKDVYHVTKESEGKVHYFFTVEAGDISDATAPKGMKGRKGSSKKFSALPKPVQTYVRTNVGALMSL